MCEINVDDSNNYYSSEAGILYNKEKTVLFAYPQNKIINSIVIPNLVTSIGDFAFSHCESLSEIVIPNSVTSIGTSAFYYC